MKIIGIDLGTTFSLVAEYNRETKTVTVIPDDSGGFVVPSAVYYPESGPPIVGQEAINAGDYAGDRLVRFIKMNMGTEYRKRLGDRDYTPAEVSSEILKKLKKNAETYLNIGPDDFERIVITVPAYFLDAPCAATLEAARLAGFDMSKVRLFPEPCAAAVAYVAESATDLASGRRLVLVSDLGGGTYDATVIETTPVGAPDGRGHLQVDIVRKEGSQELGGVLWDDALEAHVKERCAAGASDGHSPGGSDPSLAHALRERVIRGKENLSTLPTVKIPCCTGKFQEVDVATFEEKTASLLSQVEVKLRKVLEDDRQRQEQLIADGKQDKIMEPDPVLLAGGASKMPQVRQLIQNITGREPRIHRSLEQIVAIGAAYEAAIISDVPVQTVGGLVLEESRSILGANVGVLATSPARNADEHVFVLLNGDQQGVEKSREDLAVKEDGQSGIEFVLLEGDSADPEHCAVLGRATLRLPPNQRRGTKVKVILTYGENQTIVGKGICFTSEGPREVPIQIQRKQM